MTQRTSGVSKRRIAAKSGTGGPAGDISLEDESELPSLTADLVARHADARVLSFSIGPDGSAEDDVDDNRFDGIELLARKGEAEPSGFAPQSARTPVPAGNDAEEEISYLHQEIGELQAALAERDSEVNRLTLVIEQAGAAWAGEAQDLLQKAEESWKAGEAERFAAAEARWREDSLKAAGEQSSQANTIREQAESELRRVRDESTAMKAALAARDAELAQMRSSLDETHKRWQQEWEAAFAKAKTAWKADTDGELQQLRSEVSALKTTLTDRETALAAASAAGEQKTETSPSEEQPAHDGVARTLAGERISEEFSALREKHAAEQERRAARRRGPIRDLIVAAAVAVLGFVVYPRIETYLPDSWREKPAAVASESTPAASATASPAPPVAAEKPPAAKPAVSIIVRSVELRASPSASAVVIATLPPGVKVITIGRSGNWTQVQVQTDARNPKLREGWVLGSFARDETASTKSAPAGKSAEKSD